LYPVVMGNEVSIWEKPGVVDELDRVIQGTTDMDTVMAQIPGLFGTSDKATYFGFRAIGLTRPQALEVLNLPKSIIGVWTEETPQFEEFEYKCLHELQSKVGADIVRLGFLRNMTMFMLRDQMTIRKSLIDMEGISGRDFAYLRAIRRHYTNQDLLALEKAIAPEKHRVNTLVLSFGDKAFEIIDDDAGNHIRQVEDSRDD
jgi:hypothetical protein